MIDNISSSQTHTDVSEKRKKRNSKSIVLVGLCIVLLVASVLLVLDTISAGSEALKDAYLTAYNEEKESTYKDIYDYFYDYAEKEYHVSNRVSIMVGDLKEQEQLEVLKVSDIEFIIEDKKDNSSGIITWLKVPGDGTFVVNLKAGEYIIDNSRSYILIRVPYPELTNVKIDYVGVEKLFFKDNWYNGSYSEGEDMAQKLYAKAELLMKKEFMSNQNFYLTAQDTARSTISNLVKQMNPDVTDLIVDVEFY